MLNSGIQWTTHTWNVAVGCEKVDEDCKFCYMFRGSLNGTRYNPREIRKTKTVFKLPLKIKEPARIFTSSLTDFFHPEIDSYRHECWEIIRQCPQHTFQILSKRPERMAAKVPWERTPWPNVWLGTSVGHSAGLHRIDKLLQVPAKVRFVSLEPLHGEIDLSKYLYTDCYCSVYPYVNGVNKKSEPMQNADCTLHDVSGKVGLDWVIVGGESGNENGQYKYRPCKLEWIESIVAQCQAAGVPVFVKQLGTHLAKVMGLKDRHGGFIDEWPSHLQIREFPRGI
jgi:protein gp37